MSTRRPGSNAHSRALRNDKISDQFLSVLRYACRSSSIWTSRSPRRGRSFAGWLPSRRDATQEFAIPRRDDARRAEPPPSLPPPSRLPSLPSFPPSLSGGGEGGIKGGESWERNNERPPRTPAHTHTHAEPHTGARARLRARAPLANGVSEREREGGKGSVQKGGNAVGEREEAREEEEEEEEAMEEEEKVRRQERARGEGGREK